MSTWNIWTLWASLPQEVAPWMIAAEDEASWEGDPTRCEAEFKAARKRAEASGYIVREITLSVDMSELDKAFSPPTIAVTADPT